MDDPLHAELAGALSSAAKDEHDQASQDEQAEAFEPGDELTAGGYARWQREQDSDQGEHEEPGEGRDP